MDFLPDSRGLKRITSQLLLYLFVVRTLGDCPKPLLVQNTVLSNEALLMNEFPNNIEITLRCANGYVKDGGSGIMKCVDGAWGDPDLTCRKKDCGPPPPQPHMKFNMDQGTLFGAVIEVTCDPGYTILGTSYKQCFNAGWTGRTKCEIVICGAPAEISNGRTSWDSADNPKYGEFIQYFCDEGYALIGKVELMCNEGGKYDAPPPQCQSMTKEDTFTTKTVMPTTTTPAQETSTFLQDTTSGHKDTTLSESVSLFARGGGGIFTAEDNTTSTTTSTMPSSYQEEQENIVDTNKDIGYTPVAISVVCVSLVVCIAVFFIHKFLHKRKGSYDTREDLKPELLQFQNL